MNINLVIKPEITEDMSVLDIVKYRTPANWDCVFEESIAELTDISTILDNKEKTFGSYYPLKKHLFRAFELTPLELVRVVIFGQDPYHTFSSFTNKPTAQGIAFSVDRNDKIPPSLKVMFKELRNTMNNFKVPSHGDLRAWTRQGVLLCNACLTVDPHVGGSHKEIWKGFLRHVIEGILSKNKKCVFVLMGRKAEELGELIGTRGKTMIVPHPSPLNTKYKFEGCGIFKQINEYLESNKSKAIDWNLDP